MRCNALTCGNDRCNVCRPVEALLENLEAGRPEDFRLVMASVPGIIPGKG